MLDFNQVVMVLSDGQVILYDLVNRVVLKTTRVGPVSPDRMHCVYDMTASRHFLILGQAEGLCKVDLDGLDIREEPHPAGEQWVLMVNRSDANQVVVSQQRVLEVLGLVV